MIARAQDKQARDAYKVIRREMMRAVRAAASRFVFAGGVSIPSDFRPRLGQIFSVIHERAILESVLRAQRLLKFGRPDLEAKFDWPAMARRFLEQFSAEYMGRKIVSVEESLISDLVRVAKAGALEGDGQDAIARRMVVVSESITRTSAARIARTEVHGASGFGSTKTVEAIGDADILLREWVAVGDERTRVAHTDADGQRRPIGAPFDVGGELLMFPGDPSGSAGNVINCRCVAVEVLAEA